MLDQLIFLSQQEPIVNMDRATPTQETQSLFDIIAAGGPLGWVIIGLQLFMLFVAISIFIERYLTIKKASQIDESFMNNIRFNVQSGNIQGAKALCQATDSPVARMVEKGRMRTGKPLRDIDAAI